jgi:aminopeptidase N
MQLLRLAFVTLLLTNAACQVTELGSYQADNDKADTVEISENTALPEVTQPVQLPYRASRSRLFDLLHTKLEVSFNMAEHSLDGTATLQLRPYFHPQSQLLLDAKGFDIHQVVLLAEGDEVPLRYTYDDYQIAIELGKSFSRQEEFLLKINYTARPDEVALKGSAAISEDKGLYFIGTDTTQLFQKPQQIWTQGETQANSCWFPTIDAPNERTTQEMYITVDSTYRTLSNGVLVYSQFNDDNTRTDYWKMDQPHAPYLFMMAVGDFAIVEDQWRDKKVSYYVEPEYEKYARDIFGNTPEMLDYFSETLGVDYPWDKYAQVVVRDFVSGAMENTTASVFMEDLQVDDRELLDYHWDGIIAHELFHHWFGDLVTCESWANLPLNESFATYAEYLWHTHKYGKDEGDYVLWEQGLNYFSEAEEKQVDLIRFRYADQEDMFDRHSYDKGSRILHMLRKYLGDEVFFSALQYYLQEHAYSSVEVHDLRMAFEEVSGEDLNWFFNQWFLASGHPQLEVRHQYDSGVLTLEVSQTQALSANPLYYLPMTVEIWEAGKSKLYPLLIDQQVNKWEFELSSRPELVLLDPDASMLVEMGHQKDKSEWMFQATHATNFTHRLAALEFLTADSLDTQIAAKVKAALNDPYWAIRQTALNILETNPDYISAADITKISKMASQDKKSLVRADALSVLAALDADQFQADFLKAMQDSAYSVVGSAIAAYTQGSATDKAEKFAPYEKYSNFNVVIALADFYTESGVDGKYSWFEQKFQQINDEALYYLLNYFARYLIDLQNEELKAGIALLGEYAKLHPKYYIRLNAYRSLSFFDDQEEVQLLRKEIREAEKDQRLQSIYQSIP